MSVNAIGTRGAPSPSGEMNAMRSLMVLGLSLMVLGGCATAPANATAESRVISCTAGSDCDAKWSRAMQWLQKNSSWKVNSATDMLSTEGEPTTEKPAFEVTKVALEDGSGFQISMRAWCGAGDCESLVQRLRGDFYSYVMAR